MTANTNPFRFIQFEVGGMFDRISPNLRANLLEGTALEFDKNAPHFCYSREEVWLVLSYILQNDNLLPIYTNLSFRENIRCYLEHFIDPYLGRQHEIVEFEFVSTSTDKQPEEVPPCVLMHGRFNGVPHPGYVRSLLFGKKYFDLPLTLMIETDEYSKGYGQLPFLDVVFRASLLWHTGCIDRLVINQAPFHGTEDDEHGIEYYWDLMYGVDTFILNPAVLIAHGHEDFERKERRCPQRLSIRTLDMLQLPGHEDFHMSGLRKGEISAEDVRRTWQESVTPHLPLRVDEA